MGVFYLTFEVYLSKRSRNSSLPNSLVARLGRTDILLLKEFYVTGGAHPDDTTGHVLRLLFQLYDKNLDTFVLRKQ